MELTVKTHTLTYPIYIEEGCINNIKDHVNLNRKVMIITDENIPEEYIETVRKQCKEAFVYTSISGEDAKSLENYQYVCEYMLECQMSRADLVIAIGGGVIGDLSGFVAATYMRGIEFVNIPTTTLSQIDSSIGGKVAVNLGLTKNIIGAFYPPIAVFIDFQTLKSLPKRHYYNGLVEALKAGLIYDSSIFDLFETADIDDNLAEIIYKSLVMKKNVVEEDEFEMGIRKILNFGHTIGHGLESYFNLHDLLHGEAVALGMLCVVPDELKARMLAIYQKLNLPTNVSYEVNEVYHYIENDKKAKHGRISLIKVDEIGKAYIEDVELEEIRKLLEVNACQAH
ncbi:MAG: 3-dehydroquinate synthase [Erysipelotrichales bacterium]|nr:3-dehydroquinate synthase [Erysipelotrichales bacterium]